MQCMIKDMLSFSKLMISEEADYFKAMFEDDVSKAFQVYTWSYHEDHACNMSSKGALLT